MVRHGSAGANVLNNLQCLYTGLGPRRLSVLCGVAHSNVLLDWLERYKQSEVIDFSLIPLYKCRVDIAAP